MKYIENTTQENQILDLLRSRKEKGVYVYELQDSYPRGLGIAQYNARIKGLRSKGFTIKNVEKGHFVLIEGDIYITTKTKKGRKVVKNPNKGRVIQYWNNGQLMVTQL